MGERRVRNAKATGSIPVPSKFLLRKNWEHWSMRHWNNGEGSQCGLIF